MDKKQKKKLKRTAKKKKDKAAAEEFESKLKSQMNMFDRMPKECSACGKDFPRTRDAHLSWQIMAWTDPPKVRLFCPECQEKAKKLVENNDEV